MLHPETPERVEDVRRALRRLLELLAREVVQDLFGEPMLDADSATSAATPETSSGLARLSESAPSDR
jgi:hypothetical protein